MAGEVVPNKCGLRNPVGTANGLSAAGLRPPRCRHEKRDRRAEYEPISAPQKTGSGAGKKPATKALPYIMEIRNSHASKEMCLY
jgi:hypothetical protein